MNLDYWPRNLVMGYSSHSVHFRCVERPLLLVHGRSSVELARCPLSMALSKAAQTVQGTILLAGAAVKEIFYYYSYYPNGDPT